MAAAMTPGRRKAMHVGSPATAIHDRVAPGPGDIVIRKSRVSAFSATDLDRQLREAGITTLILAAWLLRAVITPPASRTPCCLGDLAG